jgi:hypothetical protein
MIIACRVEGRAWNGLGSVRHERMAFRSTRAAMPDLSIRLPMIRPQMLF